MYILSYYHEINYGLESASNIICYLFCEEPSAAFRASDLLNHFSFFYYGRQKMHTKISDLNRYIILFELVKFLKIFLKEISYSHQGCIYLLKNTVKTVAL